MVCCRFMTSDPRAFRPTSRTSSAWGPMARTLGDLALSLDVLTAQPAPSSRVWRKVPVAALRIAITRSLPGAEPSPETLASLDALADGLRRDGHQVELGSGPAIPNEQAWRVWERLLGHLAWGGIPKPLRRDPAHPF